MFCNHCGKKFETWKSKNGWEQDELCRDCHFNKWEKRESWVGKNVFCIICGKLLYATPHKSATGKIYLSCGCTKYCSVCKKIEQAKVYKKQDRRCVVCDALLVDKATKYCPTHKPPKNSGRSIAWQKNNPDKVNASQFTRYRPDLVTVLYECRCEHPKKHNHHFNYKLKHLVIRLCPACHAAEHKRLRDLSSPKTATISTARYFGSNDALEDSAGQKVAAMAQSAGVTAQACK